MKGDLLKRLFRALASEDKTAIQSMLSVVVKEERKKGHTLLAEQLQNITHKSNPQSPRIPPEISALSPNISRDAISSAPSSGVLSKTPDTHSLTLLSSKQRFSHPSLLRFIESVYDTI